jgi:adenylate cyclase
MGRKMENNNKNVNIDVAPALYEKRREEDKVFLFPRGAKLVLIISALVLISLGSITVLVSVLVSQDLRVSAEDNNFEVNRRSAIETEIAFTNIRAQTRLLIQVIEESGEGSALASKTARTFFEDNQHIAALVMNSEESTLSENHGGYSGRVLINEIFFLRKNIDASFADAWARNNIDVLKQNKGEVLLFNAAPDFTVHVLALVFPLENKNNIAVLFSPESLVDSFGFGTNQSYLVNDKDDILIHSDFELVRTGANAASWKFVSDMRQSEHRNLQTLYADNEGIRYFGAFTKLNTGNAALITIIEYDKVFEGIVATTKRNIFLTISILGISILLIWFFAKTISIPLKKLTAAAEKIEGGKFQINLPGKRRDEIGVLNSSFQKMSSALGIFGRFTNREIALLAMRGQIKPGGLPKHATIFFSDIRGFTATSEKFTKEFGSGSSDKIVLWLNEYLSRMVECVEKTGGAIDKFIGDAVMAHWGTAYTSGNPKQDAFNCVEAALLMRDAVLKLNRSRQPGDKANPEIKIGCGINTGMVTAGQIGSDQRMEYTVIGDPVNLASRIESLCKPLCADILISENTWNMVKNDFIVEEMPSVTVKGIEKPVRIFAVINFSAAKDAPKTLTQVRKMMRIPDPEQENTDRSAE